MIWDSLGVTENRKERAKETICGKIKKYEQLKKGAAEVKKEVLPACLYQQRTKMWENWKRWPNQRNCEHPNRSQKPSWHLSGWPAHGQRAPATGHGAAPLPLTPGLPTRSSGHLLPAARRSAARTYRSGNSSTHLGVTIFRLLINSFCTKAMVIVFCEEKERGGSHRRTQRKQCCMMRGMPPYLLMKN